jgi:hypothetical protein
MLNIVIYKHILYIMIGIKSHFKTSYGLTVKLLETKSIEECRALIERYTYAYICIYICFYAYIYIYIYIYVYIHIYVHMYIHVFMYTYVYIGASVHIYYRKE